MGNDRGVTPITLAESQVCKLHQQQQNLADEQAMTAQSYADPAWSWGAWGPWGPVAPYGFVYGPGYGW